MNAGTIAPAKQLDNGSTDNCGIFGYTLSNTAFDCSNVGVTTVSLIVRDVNGNASTCTATVTVQDLFPPVAVCRSATVLLDGAGNGTLSAAQVDNGSTDNCPPATLTVSPSTFTCTNVGFNTVVLTATDASGNFSQCTAAVQVQDLVPPTAVCRNVTLNLNASGTGSITAAQVDNGSTDNCNSTNLVLAVFPNSFNCNDIQLLPTTVTLTVTDAGGLVSTCLATVTIPTTPTCCGMPGQSSYYNRSASNFGGGINSSLRLNGTFTVDQSITISGNNTIIDMGANARIVVLPGKTLTIDGATIQAGCGEMWDGIYLSSPTSAIVMTGGNLNDALNGIVSDNGAPFTLNGTTFRRNLHALQVRSYAGLLPHPGTVKSCKFYDGTLITPQPGGLNGFAAIRVSDVRGLTIGFPDNNATTENLFQSQTPNVAGGGLQYGILIQNSTVNVFHNRFRDIVPPLGPGVYSVGTYCGVATFGAANFPTVNVGHPNTTNGSLLTRHANTFIGCQQGVFAERPQHINVRGNTLDRGVRDGVFLRRIHGSDPHIERNTLTNCNSGILVGDSRNLNGTVSNNTINGDNLAFRFGVQLQVLTYPATVGPGVFPMQVRDNAIDLRGNGMWINASTNVNVEGNTIRVVRGTNTLEAINGIFATSNTLLRIANNPSISSAGAGSTNLQTAGIYVNRSFQTMVLCNTMRDIGRCAVFEGDCEPSDFLGNTMRNGVDGFVVVDGKIGEQGRQPFQGQTDGVPVENTWQNMGRSWVMMFANLGQTCLGLNSVFNVRSTNNQNPSGFPRSQVSGTGVPQAMIPQPMSNQNNAHVNCTSTIPGTGTAGGIKNVAQNRLQGNSPHVRATQFRADEWAYTALLRNPNLTVGEPVIQAYQASMTGSSLAASSTANEVLVVPDSLLARQETAQISLLGTSEANHKKVLDSRLEDAQLSPDEIAQLVIMASDCEAEGGKAVNIARGLLACEGIIVWEDPGCTRNAKVANPQTQGEGNAALVDVKCWPNPTTGKIFLAATASVSGNLKVYDAQGRLLLDRKIELGDATTEIDGSDWSQGLLLVSFTLSEGSHQSWRVLLQR